MALVVYSPKISAQTSSDIVTTGSEDFRATVVVGTGAVAKESRGFVMDGSSIAATDCSD